MAGKKGACLRVYVHYLRIRTWEMVGNILCFGSAIHNKFYTSDWYGKTTSANVMHICATCNCKATFSVLVGWQGFLNGPCLAKIKSAQAKNDWYSASHLQRTSISLFYNYKSNILNVTANLSGKKNQYEKNKCCNLAMEKWNPIPSKYTTGQSTDLDIQFEHVH